MSLSAEEKRQKAEQRALRTKIRNCFKEMGFAYLDTDGTNISLAARTVELDNTFVFENIILFCEDTIATSDRTDHLRNKKEAAEAIDGDFSTVLRWLKGEYSGKFSEFSPYPDSAYKHFHLYFSSHPLEDYDETRFSPLRLVDMGVLNYFSIMSKAIYKSARFELFDYLCLSISDIGHCSPGGEEQRIEATIITPDETTGFGNGVRLVSFMMKPSDLLECGYVLRKDGWKKDTQVYQRLAEKKRIRDIRSFVADKKKTFVNNVIVGLPDNVQIVEEGGGPIDLNDISGYGKYTLRIKKEYNSICIIDGQHRIYAHHEGDDSLESAIGPLRERLHLLVTGFIFPPDMYARDRAEFEASVFVEINKEAKKVNTNVLQYINMWRNEHSNTGVARRVVERLNRRGVFKGLFQLSEVEPARIKTSSIISFALSRLVSVDKPDDNTMLLRYWNDEKKDLLKSDRIKTAQGKEAFECYIDFCSQTINCYFSALRQVRQDDWDKPDSKILSVTSINGFLLALKSSLQVVGLKTRDEYVEHFKRLDISFDKSSIPDEGFPYSSSQYGKFSRQILRDCFEIDLESSTDTISADIETSQ